MIAPCFGQDGGGNHENPTAPAAAPIPGLEPVSGPDSLPPPAKPPLKDAPTAESLDAGQKEILTAVTDKIIADILALKNEYPELEHFGEAPWFTRGLGEFRYEYKLDSTKSSDGRLKALPGGCGLHFRLLPVEGIYSQEKYGGPSSAGGARAGITTEYSMTVDNSAEGLLKAIFGTNCCPPEYTAIIPKDLDSTFDILASKYLLKKKGVKPDFASLLKALESADPEILDSAFTELGLRSFTAQELESLPKTRERFKEPLRVTEGLTSLIKVKDNAHLPEAYLRFVKFSLLADKAGLGEHNAPGPYENWDSGEARRDRWMMSGEILTSGEERFADTEALILREDPGADGRRMALDYFAKLSSPRARNEIVGALRNPCRSVQAKAAEIVGQNQITEGQNELQRLLNSPSSNVRESARVALGKLGFPAEAPSSPRTLPDSAIALSTILWAHGLAESDIVRICARPMDSLFPSSPPDPEPRQNQLPPGVSVEEREPTRPSPGNGLTQTTHNWKVSINIGGNMMRKPWMLFTR
jgi:hypothetical protein